MKTTNTPHPETSGTSRATRTQEKPERRRRLDSTIDRLESEKVEAVREQIASLKPDLPYTVMSFLDELEPSIRDAAEIGVSATNLAATISGAISISERQLKSYAEIKGIAFSSRKPTARKRSSQKQRGTSAPKVSSNQEAKP